MCYFYNEMLQVKEIVNSIFTSKTYILYIEGCNKAWLVDIGDVEPVLDFLNYKYLTVCGVFLTHAHFDHIYGLLELLAVFPKCNVFVTEYAKEALASDKLNMSRYHESPIKYQGDNVLVVHESEEMKLFDNEPLMYFYETPGHNPGCLTMVIGDYIFTGDAYIPGENVVIKLPKGNNVLAQKSCERILKMAQGKKICPGHKVNNIKN